MLQSSKYNENLTIKNSKVNNEYYQSKSTYDVQFKELDVYINNKTTGKKSHINLADLFSKTKNPFIKAELIIEMQKLPGEILEFIVHEVDTFRDHPLTN